MTDTKTKILDLAEHYTQVNGFNGFSYLDLAEQIGIKAASVHYYFKSKDDLAIALVERTHQVHLNALENLNASLKSPRTRLQRLVKLFQDYVVDKKFCLCGMMAAELRSVSPKVRQLLSRYFGALESWLVLQFKELGQRNAKTLAIQFLSSLEGALLLARLRDDSSIVHHAMKRFVTLNEAS